MDGEVITGNGVFSDGVRSVSIEIDQATGTITKIVDLTETPDSSRKLIFPGFFDIHVHAREYPKPAASDPEQLQVWENMLRKETFASCGTAAINGGVTRFAAMPNDPTPPDNPSAYELKKTVTASSPCPVVTFACITKTGDPWADLPYKLYLDAKPSLVSFSDWSAVEEALGRYRGSRVFFHAEDPDILANAAGLGPRWVTRPAQAEISAVEKLLNLTHKYGLRTHICHISVKEAVELVQDYNKSAAVKVTCEATPHHICFSVGETGPVSVIAGHCLNPGLVGCNPPLRTEEDREFCMHALRSGIVDALASDHAPHTIQDKEAGSPGMPHLDTLGPFAGMLINAFGFTPQRIAECLAEAPANLFAADSDRKHGQLKVGYDASFTILNPGGITSISGGEIRGGGRLGTRCGWSPFDGVSLSSIVEQVFISGKTAKRVSND